MARLSFVSGDFAWNYTDLRGGICLRDRIFPWFSSEEDDRCNIGQIKLWTMWSSAITFSEPLTSGTILSMSIKLVMYFCDKIHPLYRSVYP